MRKLIAKLYIDGSYRGTALTYKAPTTTGTHKIKLAGDYKSGHSYDWNGQIKDFRIMSKQSADI